MGNGIHHFAASIYAIAPSEILQIRRLHRLWVHRHLAVIQLEMGDVFEKGKLLLSESAHHHIDFEGKFAARYRAEGAPAGGAR